MSKKLTTVTKAHYVKLVYRSLLLIIGIAFYIFQKVTTGADVNFNNFGFTPEKFGFETVLLWVIFIIYFVEMVLRLFPSKIDSMGCQKMFARNYEPTGRTKIVNVQWWRTFIVATIWIGGNSIIGVLHLLGILDAGILFILSLAFGVCDMICILFYCPFHSVFFRNRCCSDCRIYNWDFAMMFTPFAFMLGSWYTGILFALSMIILARWEITYKIHPERFSYNTNKCVDCAHCPEKLCTHKRQLAGYLKKHRSRFKPVENDAEKSKDDTPIYR